MKTTLNRFISSDACLFAITLWTMLLGYTAYGIGGPWAMGGILGCQLVAFVMLDIHGRKVQ